MTAIETRRGGAVETFCFDIESSGEARDVLVAELHALGTLGLEETDTGLRAYFMAPAPELVGAV
jgi:hypothetical protein